jgi:myosin heavy subunit
MGMDVSDIRNALTIRTVTARNEVYKVPLNAVAAKDCCDAFAKEIYARVFDWLVRKNNEATTADECFYKYYSETQKQLSTIGLLDIFGFESFEVNRFEQLCINYANEKLQEKFTQDIFRSVQAEYEYEGIELDEIKFEDNAAVLQLVEGRMGLISVLNEECVRPRGNDISFNTTSYEEYKMRRKAETLQYKTIETTSQTKQKQFANIVNNGKQYSQAQLKKIANTPKDFYSINVADKITITYSSDASCFYAINSFLQLFKFD